MRVNSLAMYAAAATTLLLGAALADQAVAQVFNEDITPLSPVIGVNPTSLDFSCTLVGQCDAEQTVDVFNDVSDPTSILEVTDFQITMGFFDIIGGPPLPVSLPGDGQTVATFTILFCPPQQGQNTGRATVTAPNATNTPLHVPLSGRGNVAPQCDAGGPYSGTVGQAVNFDGSGSTDPGGSIASYDWDFGDSSTGSGPTPSHIYATAGNYVATLTLTDDCGATSTCETSVTITMPDNQPPTCDAGGPYAGPPNSPIQFDGSGSSDPDGTVVSYEWDFGDGSSGTGAQPTHTYAQMGVYTVTLCVNDDRQARVCCSTTADIGATPVEPSTWGQIKSHYHD